MTAVFHRRTGPAPIEAVGGDGCYIIDRDGKRYLDASGGAAVSCLGHSDADVIAAIKAQLDRLPYAHTGFFTTAPAEELAEHLVAAAPDGLDKVYLVSGGSEAVEAALKLARQYQVERGQVQRHHFVARWQSYHGNTLGGLSVGGNKARRDLYAPILLEAHHIEPCFAYRHKRSDETEEDYGKRAADALEAKVRELGEDQVIAFIAEPVVGATLGAVTAAPGYFRRIRDICDRYGIVMILDEVMCGMGRTGALFACAQEGVVPDIAVIAKGLGAGYQPIGAMLCSNRIYDAIAAGSGAFQHGHTYMGHATACAGALAVQRKLAERGLVAQVGPLGDMLDAALQDRLGNHANIGDIRGRGLFRGIELVADRATKQPFDPALKLHARIREQAMAHGLICYPMGGTVDGVAGDHVLLAPPFIIEPSQIEELVDKLSATIAAVLGELP